MESPITSRATEIVSDTLMVPTAAGRLLRVDFHVADRIDCLGLTPSKQRYTHSTPLSRLDTFILYAVRLVAAPRRLGHHLCRAGSYGTCRHHRVGEADELAVDHLVPLRPGKQDTGHLRRPDHGSVVRLAGPAESACRCLDRPASASGPFGR